MKKSLPSIVAMLLSLVLIGTGIVLVAQGFSAKAQVKDELAAEHITTPDDASIPGVPVDSAATAKAQADIIQHHVLTSTDGKTYADMERDDPLRATYLSAVTLRTSLMSAYMAFKLADLVTGLGALFFALGLGGGIASFVSMRQRESARVEVSESTKASATA